MAARTSKAYYQAREQQELVLGQASFDRAIQSIHLDLAKRYADRAHEDEIAEILNNLPKDQI